MISIPQDLDDWNFAIIKELVDKKYFESDIFDFKPRVGKRVEIENLVCSFANNVGGFIIFGVRDIVVVEKPRIAGFSVKNDLINDFLNCIKGIEPSLLRFEFKQPAIEIPSSDKVLHVCKIFQSSERPHMTSEGYFKIRAKGGNRNMTYNEIKESFLDFERRKMKIEMLGLEMLYLIKNLKRMIVPENKMNSEYAVIEPTSAILIELLGQIYPLIKNDPDLIGNLHVIRSRVDTINSFMKRFLQQSILPLSNISKITLNHNLMVKENIEIVIPIIIETIEILIARYNFESPFENPEDTSKQPTFEQ